MVRLGRVGWHMSMSLSMTQSVQKAKQSRFTPSHPDPWARQCLFVLLFLCLFLVLVWYVSVPSSSFHLSILPSILVFMFFFSPPLCLCCMSMIMTKIKIQKKSTASTCKRSMTRGTLSPSMLLCDVCCDVCYVVRACACACAKCSCPCAVW